MREILSSYLPSVPDLLYTKIIIFAAYILLIKLGLSFQKYLSKIASLLAINYSSSNTCDL